MLILFLDKVWLLSKTEYNHAGTKSVHIIVSIEGEYWNIGSSG
jgi:hypothetical protein